MERDKTTDAILDAISKWADAKYARLRDAKTFDKPGDRMYYLLQGRMDSLDDLKWFIDSMRGRAIAEQEDRILRHGAGEDSQTGEKQ